MEEVNVPIKYIVLPVYNYNNDAQIIYNMVFRCYLVCDLTVYKDGTSSKYYSVVSPYNGLSKKLNEKRVYPQYDVDGMCYKTRNVTEIFDTYEEAKDYSIRLNNMIYTDLSFEEKIEYQNIAETKEELEYLFLEDTNYMIQDNKKRTLK